MNLYSGFPGGHLKLMMEPGMNLNEECLLQFLKNEGVSTCQAEVAGDEGILTTNLKRIFRRNRYVSFPPAIVIRRRDD